MNILRASEFYRERHCLPSSALVKEVEGTPREAPRESVEAQQGTDEHEELAAGKSSYMQFLANRELDQWAAEKSYAVFNEQELFLRYDWLEPYFIGHPDRFAIRSDGSFKILDFKTGPIPAIDYWTDQLQSYQVLVEANYGSQTFKFGDVERPEPASLTVISKFHGVVNIEPTEPKEHRQLIQDVAKNRGQGQFFAGPWCRYCPARLVCEYAEKSVDLVKPQPLPTGELGADMLGRLKLLKGLVEEKITWYEDLVRRDPAILANKWKVGKGRTTGKIRNVDQALRLLSHNPVGPMENLRGETLSLSFAKLRDYLAKRNNHTKEETTNSLTSILGELLTFETSKGAIEEVHPEIEDK